MREWRRLLFRRTSFLVLFVTTFYIGCWVTIGKFEWRRMFKTEKANQDLVSFYQHVPKRIEGLNDFFSKLLSSGNHFRETRQVLNAANTSNNVTTTNATILSDTTTNITLSETRINETISYESMTNSATVFEMTRNKMQSFDNDTFSNASGFSETTTNSTIVFETTINEIQSFDNVRFSNATVLSETTTNSTIVFEKTTFSNVTSPATSLSNTTGIVISQILLQKLKRFFALFREYIMKSLYNALQLTLKAKKIRERIIQILMKKIVEEDLNNAVAEMERNIKEVLLSSKMKKDIEDALLKMVEEVELFS